MPMEEFNQFKDDNVEEDSESEAKEDEPMGMPLTGPQRKEKKRIEKLKENFGQMYEEEL